MNESIRRDYFPEFASVTGNYLRDFEFYEELFYLYLTMAHVQAHHMDREFNRQRDLKKLVQAAQEKTNGAD